MSRKLNSARSIFLSMFLFALMSIQAYSTTTSDVFRTHQKRIFIETGSYRGDGIQNALDAGFEEIYSVELAPHLYEYCCDRFAGNPHVHLYLGDSSIVLKTILDEIYEPATFWLDGHYSSGDTAKGQLNSPILHELSIIKNHHIKTHTILIDDVRMFGTNDFDGVTEIIITQALLSINPEYNLYYQDGYQANDVLVAEIKS